MGMPLERKAPSGPAMESASKKELLKLVHKLRWAGMDDEAERLLDTLQQAQTLAEDRIVATPTESD